MELEEAVRRVFEATYGVRAKNLPIDAFSVVFSPEDFRELKARAWKDRTQAVPFEYRFGGLPVEVDRSLKPGDIVLRAEVVA